MKAWALALIFVSFWAGAQSPCSRLEFLQTRIPSLGESEFMPLLNDLVADLGKDAPGNNCYQAELKTMRDLLRHAFPELQRQPRFHSLKGQYEILIGDTAEAKKSFQAAVALNTSDIEANFGLSYLAHDEGEFELEELYLKRAVLESPKTSLEKTTQQKVYKRLVDVANADAALKYAQAWAKLDTTDPKPIIALAKLCLDLKDYVKLEEVVGKIPAPLSFYYGAQLDVAKKEWALAVETYRKFLAAKPSDAELVILARAGLAEALLNMNEPLRARVAAEIGLALAPKNLRMQKVHEQALLRGGYNLKNPVEDLEQAALVNPSSVGIQKRAVELIMRGPKAAGAGLDPRILRQAEAHVDLILSEEAQDLDALYWKGVIRARKKNAEADAYFDQALALLKSGQKPSGDLKEIEIWLAAADSRLAQSRNAEARQILQDALATHPEDPADLDKIRRKMNFNLAK